MRRRFLVALILASVILSAAYGVYEFQLKPNLEWKGTVDSLVSSSKRLEIYNYATGSGIAFDRNSSMTGPVFEKILGYLKSSTLMKATEKTVVQGNTTVSVTIPLPHYSLTFELNDGSKLKLDLVTENGVGVIWFESESAIYEVQVSSDLVKLLEEEFFPTPTPDVSPYLAEFRSHPELFISHTTIVHVLFQDESGNRLGNLTSIYEVKREGYTLYLNINHSFTCDSSIQNLTFASGGVLCAGEGNFPIPGPTPIPQEVTLRNGETVILYKENKEIGGNWVYSQLGESWEYVSMKIDTCLRYFQIQFSDGRKWQSKEDRCLSPGFDGDLFAFLYLNKVEVETETIQIKTV